MAGGAAYREHHLQAEGRDVSGGNKRRATPKLTAASCPELAAALAPLLAGFSEADWPDRVAGVEAWLFQLHRLLGNAAAGQRRGVCVAARTAITVMVEAAGKPDIGCLESAVLAHLSIHTDLRLRSCEWLESVDDGELEEFLARHPGILATLTATTGQAAP